MIKIEGTGTPNSGVNAKRLFLPGIVVKSTCPGCGRENVVDLGDDYLSYPVLNGPDVVHFYCCCSEHGGESDTEWNEPIVVRVTVEAG